MKNLIILYGRNREFCQGKVELLHPFCPLSKACLGFLFFSKDLETEDEKSNILHTNALMFLCQVFYSLHFFLWRVIFAFLPFREWKEVIYPSIEKIIPRGSVIIWKKKLQDTKDAPNHLFLVQFLDSHLLLFYLLKHLIKKSIQIVIVALPYFIWK